MAASSPQTPSFISVLLLSCLLINAHGGTTTHHIIRVDSLLPSTNCSTSKGLQRASTLQISHRHGPCTPIPDKRHPTPAETLLHDNPRVEFLQRRNRARLEPSSVSDAATTIPARSGLPIGYGNYIVTVGYGTPKRDLTVAFDTGSSLSWVQCEPCLISCYSQQDPIFDPSTSSSYRNVSCGSTECNQVGLNCSASNCLYGVPYGDNSFTVGFLATDTLTLQSSEAFQGFVFGCGQDNEGLFKGVAGLLGLGRDYASLVSQTSAAFGRVFSYCLPSTTSSTGYLTFGPHSAAAAFTPLKSSPRSDLYDVGLTGISVGGRQLAIPTSVFTTAGTIVDSGTVITRLPPIAYGALRTAFRAGMKRYPMAAGSGLLDTCYDWSGYETVEVPTVTLHFEAGVMLGLEAVGIMYVYSERQVCLAFAGNGKGRDLGIIGNTQQKTVEVVYDVGLGRVGFRTGACN
ncbi:Protein ASPARTIC PROTEASE IN GUARD CELL 1 [Acorus calamus]|uniref:Protein ASPARTIC PROTEASE IN GUARD CELL 1 n=1 Tax=Acorus calamus TaxID=4465 RepID=A0AAV9CNG9_ACOCL|nr:Protein ASPARTIC PROTEASE IN GUARD CELL 1 [Acorus calamus]